MEMGKVCASALSPRQQANKGNTRTKFKSDLYIYIYIYDRALLSADHDRNGHIERETDREREG